MDLFLQKKTYLFYNLHGNLKIILGKINKKSLKKLKNFLKYYKTFF